MGLVTAVLCAAFDEGTNARVLAVRDLVRSAGIALSPEPRHRPHFSMVAARVTAGAELDRVLELAAVVASRHEPFDIDLSEVGRFGRAGALWLGPSASAPLAQLQRDAADSLVRTGFASAFGTRSEPTGWVAHCTLATRVPKPQLRRVQSTVQATIHGGLQAGVRAIEWPIAARVDAVATILVGGRGDVGLIPLG